MKISLYSIIVSLILLQSCANVVSPQGGKKDITPPQVLGYYPDNESTRFKETTIQILFDEYIQATDIFNQVVISPPMAEQPSFKVKGKKLIIQLNETLRDSTTYTINFGSSIKDITESNTLENFTYVFSTGDILDSLEVAGNIKNILTNKPETNTYAVLYPSSLTPELRTKSPWYFAKTSTNGDFVIQNIKSGDYYLFGVLDQNFNYYYDLPNEMIAFPDSIITIDTIKKNYALRLFSEDLLKQQLIDARAISYGSCRLVFSKSTDSVEIFPLTLQDKNYLMEKNAGADSVIYWFSDSTLKELQFRVLFDLIDSIVVINTKSFPANFFNLKSSVKSNLQGASKAASSMENPYTFDLNKYIFLHSANPIQSVDTNKIRIYQDSAMIPSDITFTINPKNIHELISNKKPVPNSNYKLQLEKGAITDMFGLQNDTISIYFKTKDVKDYGNLKLNINSDTNFPIIVELLKEDLSVTRNTVVASGTGEIFMPLILPGTYLLRAKIDANKNGIWDTGNLDKNLQPEQIIYFENTIPIRANWDQSIDWIISY